MIDRSSEGHKRRVKRRERWKRTQNWVLIALAIILIYSCIEYKKEQGRLPIASYNDDNPF